MRNSNFGTLPFKKYEYVLGVELFKKMIDYANSIKKKKILLMSCLPMVMLKKYQS